MSEDFDNEQGAALNYLASALSNDIERLDLFCDQLYEEIQKGISGAEPDPTAPPRRRLELVKAEPEAG